MEVLGINVSGSLMFLNKIEATYMQIRATRKDHPLMLNFRSPFLFCYSLIASYNFRLMVICAVVYCFSGISM